MRRVWTTRGMFLPLVLLIVASLVFIGRGANQTEASAFSPALTARLCTPGTGEVGSPPPPACVPLNAAGATASINENADWGTSALTGTRAFPSSSIYFTPSGWGIPDCSPIASCPYPIGEKTGSFTSVTTFGVFGTLPCIFATPVGFPGGMRNASTDRNDPITMPPDTTPSSLPVLFANLTEDDGDFDEDGIVDAPPNGIQDGAEHWNTLLAGLVNAGLLPPVDPRERQYLNTTAVGTAVWVDVLTYDPGVLGPDYATTFVLQNANPLNPPAPGTITDTCGLFNGFTQSGTSSPGGIIHRTNPGAGTQLFALQSGSSRDADGPPSGPPEPTTFSAGPLSGFGLVNNLDTCPYQPNDGSPLVPVFTGPLNGDDGEPSGGDGIDSVCDAFPAAFGGTDVDSDGYLNRGDNCPQTPNGVIGLNPVNQADTSEVAGPAAANEVGQQPVDGGPASDGIGNDCDMNLAVPDGHFHPRLNLAPVCVGAAGADTEPDGWCDADEIAIGGGTAGTPEALSVPGSCSNAPVDDDLDGAIDLLDTGCQKPAHDISIKKLTGNTIVCPSGSKAELTLHINNLSGGTENAQIGVLLDSVPSYLPAAGPPPLTPGKSAGSVTAINGGGTTITGSGPINIDGDADVEWLTRATATAVNSGSNAVHIKIDFPACTGGSNINPVDYTVTVDVCHGDDIAPLGLFGAAACGAPADAGQDRVNVGNDAPVTRLIDDTTR